MPAGASLSGVHPTIANLKVVLYDSTSSNLNTTGGPILIAHITGNPDTTASTYAKGCFLIATDVATGIASQYTNTGTYASPVWTPVTVGAVAGANQASGAPIFCLDNGTANTLLVTLYAVGTTAVPLSTGLAIAVRLKTAMVANTASTLNFNGTTKNIRKSTNPVSALLTAFAASAIIRLTYSNNVWLAQAQV